MLDYIEYFGIPASIAMVLAVFFFALQLLGKILEVKGKAVPEILKISKYFKRKRKEKETLSKITDFVDEYKTVPSTLEEVRTLLKDVREHYSEDNISKRDGWMQGVNDKFADLYARQAERDEIDAQLNAKLDKNNAIILDLLIDNKRNYILDFTSKAADLSYPLTKEQYNRFFTVYDEYEEIIEKNNLVNGQVNVAHEVVSRSFETRLKNRAFIEDAHPYDH